MHRQTLLSLVTAVALAAGCGPSDPGAFETPEAAAQALLDAVSRDDVETIVAILGPEYRDRLITDDWEAEREVRLGLVEAWKENYELQSLPGGERELLLGAERWPMPILIQQDDAGAWRVISTVIDEKPRDGQSYYQVGAWYVSQNDREAGQTWYAKAYEVEPTNGNWLWYRAELLLRMDRKDDARKLFQEIAEKKWQPRFQHLNDQAREKLKEL